MTTLATHIFLPAHRLACLLALVVLTSSALAEPGQQDRLVGLDMQQSHETLMVGGKPLRLLGISFPAEAGLCGLQPDQCRIDALKSLARWVDRPEQVECRIETTLASGLNLGRCEYRGEELGAWLVGSGLALADRRSSRRYVRDENAARRAGVGVWSAQFPQSRTTWLEGH